MTSYAIGGVDMTTLGEHRPTRPDGVCTEACTRDADCPATMRCGDAISYEFHLGSRVKRCTPLAWDDATSPR